MTKKEILPGKEVLEIARDYGFDTAKYIGRWNNYDVFDPVFNDPDKVAYIGKPIFILQNEQEVRESAFFEWPEIMETLS